MADPTHFWSAIFMFCSENGRWQSVTSSSAYGHTCIQWNLSIMDTLGTENQLAIKRF